MNHITSPAPRYDYVFLGAGLSSLSLLARMISSGKFRDKTILLVDREPVKNNDRTWCYWEQAPGFFEPVVFKKWNQLGIASSSGEKNFSISPYQYKMIRSGDLYNYCFNLLKKQSQADFYSCPIQSASFNNGQLVLYNGRSGIAIEAGRVMNSILFDHHRSRLFPGVRSGLLQHFKGWFIRTEQDTFDPARAMLMDFRVPQQQGASFVYVMPFNERQALVEYTQFTPSLLQEKEYDQALGHYLHHNLKLTDYYIQEQEFGVIPMSPFRLPSFHANMYQLGTAGGQTRASSGYTFQFVQKHSEKLMDHLLKEESPRALPTAPARYHFYDRVLLRILAENGQMGSRVFYRLFERNDPALVLKFLDAETSLREDLKLISTLPTWPFLKSAMRSF